MAVAEIRGGLGRHHGLSILTETFLNNIMKFDREQQEKKLKRNKKWESVYLTQTVVCSIHTSTQKALEKSVLTSGSYKFGFKFWL